MGGIGDAVSYTVLALGFVIMIFLGALFFVQATRRGNRRFKWWRGQRGDGADAAQKTAAQRSASANSRGS
jgi:hypothetical protein